MSLLRWYLAATFGLILCRFIVNPHSFVPAVATSAVHTLTQSAWQLLQYWKVGSITLFAATIKLGAQLLFERLSRQMTSLLFGQVTCTADSGENTYEDNWNIAELDENRFFGVGPHWYFRPRMWLLSGTYVYWTGEQQPMLLVYSKANSLLELVRYDEPCVLGELVEQVYAGRRLTYWDARLKTTHTISEAIAECKDLDRKGFTEKHLWRAALAHKKTCFVYYCSKLNYFYSGVWRRVQVASLVPATEGWFVI
jgi:hypothetical protein